MLLEWRGFIWPDFIVEGRAILYVWDVLGLGVGITWIWNWGFPFVFCGFPDFFVGFTGPIRSTFFQDPFGQFSRLFWIIIKNFLDNFQDPFGQFSRLFLTIFKTIFDNHKKLLSNPPTGGYTNGV